MQNQSGLTGNNQEGGNHMMMNMPDGNGSKKRALDGNSPEEDDNNFGDDDKLAKKQRRLVKNREAAAQFRHRQKAYMQKLEKHAEELTQSNVQVTAKIELLDTENKLMKEQLAYLRNFMKQAVALSFPNSLPSLPPDSMVAPPSAQPAIPDLFDDFPPPPHHSMDSKLNIKMEPTHSIVPDITNTTIASLVPGNGTNPSPPPTRHHPHNDPSLVMPTFIAPPLSHHEHSMHNHTTATTTNINHFSSLPHHSSLTKQPREPSREAFITSTNLLADPYLAAAIPTPTTTVSPPQPSLLTVSALLAAPSPSPLLGSSSSLSAIFNSILGTDLSFSGILVKPEPLDPPQP